MSKKQPTTDNELPSFEELAGGLEKREIPGRATDTKASRNKPPGEMRVYGHNPAGKWFEELPFHDLALSRKLIEQVKDLRGEAFGKAIWAAYTKHYYSTEQQQQNVWPVVK